jgi:hypothetical protein
MTTRYSTSKKMLALVIAIAVLFPSATGAAGPADVSVPGQLAQIQATLQQLIDLLNPPAPPADNTTRLLFPFATSQAGFDTALVVSNTGKDSTGIVGIAGTCTMHFFGVNAPPPITTGNVMPGAQAALQVSAFAPAFQGYVEAACDFPLAHGFGLLSDSGVRNLAATVPALVIPNHRKTSLSESVGQ